MVMSIKLKTKVLTHYGNGKCACVRCGFNDIRALSIDHIEGYGKKLPKTSSFRSGTGLYYYIQRMCFPKGFQTLCMNCQFIKRHIDREHLNGKYNTNNNLDNPPSILRLL